MDTPRYKTRTVTLDGCPIVVYDGTAFQVLIAEQDVRKCIQEMARELAATSGEVPPVVVGVLNGGVYVAVTISESLAIPHQIGFVGVSSYGNLRTPEHDPSVTNDLSCSVKGKDVVLVEDIIETGRTLRFAVEYLKLKGATRVRVVCLLEKDIPGEPRVIQPDIVGFSVPSSAFVVGWGLDHKGFFRNMPFIGVTVE